MKKVFRVGFKVLRKTLKFSLLVVAAMPDEEEYKPTQAEIMYGEKLFASGKYVIPDHLANK